jgi:hypothetical protein
VYSSFGELACTFVVRVHEASVAERERERERERREREREERERERKGLHTEDTHRGHTHTQRER